MLRPPQFLAAHFDALVFLIFLAVTGIFRLLASKAQQAQKRDKEPEPPRPQPTFEPDPEISDQERIRRFLEALGQPTSAAPPPPVKPRPAAQYQPAPGLERARTIRPRGILNPVPPLTTVPPPLPRKIQVPRQMTKLPETETPRTFQPTRPPVEEYTVQETAAAPAPPPPPLATPADAYAAMTKPVSPTTTVPAKPLFSVLLGKPEALRQAIVLREILGPPRALSPLDV